ncbi:MAG: hypothetical protein P4L53_25810 [Candidatus Obscuribacterales bacterium]|nr:hypothetical protein [Candidatus Obscuribacterales bacterium]
MGLADLAAREAIELTAKTAAGKTAIDASVRGIAEVLESFGLKKAATAVSKGQLGPDELDFLKHETDAIAQGRVWLPSGEVVTSGPNVFNAANAHRALLTKIADGTRKVADHYGPIPDPMEFPKEWLETGQYQYERSWNPIGASTHRLVSALPKVTPRILAGDTVATGESSEHVTGNLVSIHPNTEVGPTAIVRMHQEYFAQPHLDTSELVPVTGKLWRSESGAVFSGPAADSVDIPDAASLKFLANIRAANPDAVRFLSGVRPFPEEARPLLDNSNALIRANTSKPMSLLYALSSAPEHAFAESPLIPWKTASVFNPRGLSSNCMACTAGVFRTLQTGTLTTAEDITRMVSSTGARIGEPIFGRFENENEALDWFKEAANVRIVDSLSSTRQLKTGSSYALTINVNPRSGDLLHMGFAHVFEDNSSVFFDGQSGVQWKEGSFAKSGLPARFYEVQFGK